MKRGANVQQLNQQGQATTLVHYAHQTSPERIACMPNMAEFHQTPYHPNYQRSNDVRGVNCPACRATQVFKDCTAVLETALKEKIGGR